MAQIWELHHNGFINDCNDHSSTFCCDNTKGRKLKVWGYLLHLEGPLSFFSYLRSMILLPSSHAQVTHTALGMTPCQVKGHKVIIWREATPHRQDLGDGRPPYWIQSLPFTITYQLHILYGGSLGYPCEFNILPIAHNCIRVAVCEEWSLKQQQEHHLGSC